MHSRCSAAACPFICRREHYGEIFSKQPACEHKVTQSWWQELEFLWLYIFLCLHFLKWKHLLCFPYKHAGAICGKWLTGFHFCLLIRTFKDFNCLISCLWDKQWTLMLLLPWNLFMGNLVRHCIWARWSPGETDITAGRDSFKFLLLPLLYYSSFLSGLANSHVVLQDYIQVRSNSDPDVLYQVAATHSPINGHKTCHWLIYLTQSC